MEKRRGIALPVFLLVLACIVTLVLCDRYMKNHINLGGKMVSRNIEALDLRGNNLDNPEILAELTCLKTLDLRDTGLTQQQYVSLSRMLPGCEILWSIPFQGDFTDMDITILRAEQLNPEDLRMLPYFTALKTLDLRGCRDYALLRELMLSRPDLKVVYDVEIGGKVYLWNTRVMDLENPDPDLLEELIPMLPHLKRVTISGSGPEAERIHRWMAEYPDITFDWKFTVCGVTASSLDTRLILNDIPMESVEEVEAALENFYNLTWVEMCNCGIPSEEMDALWKRHPETRFVWSVRVGTAVLRTDVETFMPYKFGYRGSKELYDRDTKELKYCVDMVCLDMGHMEISDYSFVAYMPKLKYLILADTNGKDFSALAGLKELVYLELFMTRFNQAEVLTGMTKLEDLNIGHSGLNNIEPLLEMTWLKHLWLPGNKLVSPVERQRIRDTLTDTQVMFAGAGSTGDGWREIPNYYDMRDLLQMPYYPGK